MAEKSVNEMIKEALANNTAVIGTRKALKTIRTGDVASVILATNCPEDVKKDVMH